MKNIKLGNVISALFLILTFLANSSVAYANVIYYPSSWASQKVAISVTAGITPVDFDTIPFNKSITRLDFCELLLNTCRTFGITLPSAPMSSPFSDTTDINAVNAYMLGLTQGTDAGLFSPEMPLTREMAAVMLSKLRILFQYTTDNNNKNIDWNNIGNNQNYSSDRYFKNRNTVSKTSTGSLTYTEPMDGQQAIQTLSKYSTDGDLISSWAKIYMADVYTRGILSGTGEGKLDPQSYITREQAVLLSFNVLSYCDESQIRAAGVKECILPMPTGIYISESYYRGDVYLRWNDIPLASAYDVTVFKNGISSYTTRTENNYLDLRTSSSTYNRDTKAYDITEYTNTLYSTIFGDDKQRIHVTLNVVPVNSNGEPSVFFLTDEFTIEPWANKNEMIFGDSTKTSFTSNSEALLSMTSIKVNIWKLTTSGTKVTSTLYLTVNKNVAENVKKIFTDIYNGKEKFPIKSCGAYAYRNGTSEHTSGTAIDINPQENYFIEWSGLIKVGALWQPGKNPYSISSDGDVVRAFNRYGWHWSPDMLWPNGADYMHFSLGGK
ncbi:MAG: hypothetical protein CVU84_12640 [Firmicutes bacterium HGW-Firmicutes-1]|jgi:hypothetical protein|nr:MAG: hypothetical protein CVU84_12640 [Firmicutes bacterium HGW-Firmicutes-1]